MGNRMMGADPIAHLQMPPDVQVQDAEFQEEAESAHPDQQQGERAEPHYPLAQQPTHLFLEAHAWVSNAGFGKTDWKPIRPASTTALPPCSAGGLTSPAYRSWYRAAPSHAAWPWRSSSSPRPAAGVWGWS